ncbi:MAG: 23S rRNA (adenine(2503)-C(2))-methyltransferase RlmN [Planctomycetes bacterium]|nr:23S rRNA (adenine(2503)-C(2))-methyltransferase RlmN [Planctomycetota bacterium]
MRHLLDVLSDGLPEWLEERGQPKYRAAQIRRWLFARRAASFDAMSDLPSGLRGDLERDFRILEGNIATLRQSADGTEKLVVEWSDGRRIECVLLRDGPRRSICVSSQVGCAMGCVFCASGLDGVERNLTRGEILEQMLHLQRRMPEGERLSHVVVMGMGEPLANLDRLLPALREASSKDALGISPRRITISTVGLPDAMERLAREDARFHLAVSLHAPNDALRNQLVPVNRKIGLDAVLAAADSYFERSGRRLTFEYVLLGGINDDVSHARELTHRLRGRTAMLNVIPCNPVAGLPYVAPTAARQRAFRETLERAGINVQFRERKGDAIDAACGQLRRSSSTESRVAR